MPQNHKRPGLPKTTLVIIMAYISVVGLVTFNLFIMEEGLQTIMFGTWAAQEANDWKVTLEGCDRMREIIKLIERTNKYMGWIQPLSKLAYDSYAASAEYYVRSLELKVLSYDPTLFEGRKVRIKFTPKRALKRAPKSGKEEYMLIAGRTFIRSNKPDLTPRVIHGYLFKTEDGRMEIREDE